MVVVRYHRALVDDFISIADCIEDMYPKVIVEGIEYEGDEATSGKIDIVLGDRPICSVDPGTSSHEMILDKLGDALED